MTGRHGLLGFQKYPRPTLATAYSKHVPEVITANEKRRSGKVIKVETTAVPSMGYESCIVSFIDVMGFRELLKRPAGEVLKFRTCCATSPSRSMKRRSGG